MTELQIIEHNNQRVLTTQQLAASYGTDAQIIVNNFNRNKDRYTEGKHFYRLEGEEKRGFINLNQIDVGLNTQHFYLWTEKGAWLQAKSLGTDEAWEAYEMLVDDYYNKADMLKLIAKDPIMAMRYDQIKMIQRLDDVEEKVNIAEDQAISAHTRLDNLDKVDPDGDPRQELVRLVTNYAKRNGVQYDQAWADFRQSYNIAFHTNINLKKKYYMRKHQVKKMTVPEYLETTGQIQDGLRVIQKMIPQYKKLSLV